MRWLLLVLALCPFALLLYAITPGIAVTKSIRAIVFVFRPQKGRDIVRVHGCTGWARHRVRPAADGTYGFTLDARLSDGDAQVSLLDESGQPLLTLDRGHAAETIALIQNGRYSLHWVFQNAGGTCALRWTTVE